MKQKRAPMAQATKEKIRNTHLKNAYERSDTTKEKMREAKLGKKFSLDHRLNMSVTHLLKSCRANGNCPITVTLESNRYDEETKKLLIDKILERQQESHDYS